MLKEISQEMPNDITGIRDYRMLEECGGIQWPLSQAEAFDYQSAGAETPIPSERRLFEDGHFFTADKKARFIFENPREAPELPDEEYPFVLLTGRGTSSQWHTNTRTAKSDVLRKLYPKECYVEINPQDAKRLQVQRHSLVSISSRRAQPGQLFIPMHYSEANQLTFPAFDAYSRQPSYKSCAVKIEAVDDLRKRFPPQR